MPEFDIQDLNDLLALAKSTTRIDTVPGADDLAIVPEGFEVEDLRPHLGLPPRSIDTFERLADAESFSKYVNKYKETNSLLVLFGYHDDKPQLLARLDYHEPQKPRVNEHRASVALQRDPDFEKWIGNDRKQFSQEGIAGHFRDLSHTVIEPDSATLDEAISKFEAVGTTKIVQKVSRLDGNFEMTVKDEQDVISQVKIPNRFEIGVPVFVGMKPIQLIAELRYKVREGTVFFTYVIEESSRILPRALDKIKDEVEKATDLVVLRAP